LRQALSQILQVDNFGQLNKIVVPIDFSDASINAFMYAHRLATSIDAVTEVSHVDSLKGNNKQRFNNFIEQVDTDWNSNILKSSLINKKYFQGPTNETLIKSVEETAPHLLVIGNKGNQKGTNRIGSTAASIIKNLKSNILIVPEAAKFSRLQNIIFPFKSNAHLENHLDYVIDFATPFNSHITLLKVGSKNNPSQIECIEKWKPIYQNMSIHNFNQQAEYGLRLNDNDRKKISMITIPIDLVLENNYFQNLEKSILLSNEKVPYLSLR